ncbi:MAG: hypothetical protein LBG82_08720, partial [Clostridiales Family XIII bacterium]|nr:hypothetical protein [Clostridiales Family XIII bacterium]
AADSFAFREGFRTIKAFTAFEIFRQTDMGGLYMDATGIGKFERIDEKSFRESLRKLNAFAQGITKPIESMAGTTQHTRDGSFCAAAAAQKEPSLVCPNLYFAVIPDKSMYARHSYPTYDPNTARRLLDDELQGFKVIDLTDALGAKDYYRTDLHWDQTRLSGVVAALNEEMKFGASGGLDGGVVSADGGGQSGNEILTAGKWNGVYAGQLALPVPPDTMRYAENEAMRGASAKALDPNTGEMTPLPIYDKTALTGIDPYNFFLGGSQPLITIENPNAKQRRELYICRDSFGSSLAPLLIPYYSKITLIDFRYIDSRVLPQYVTMSSGQPAEQGKPPTDILFLYSPEVLNQPTTLLVG